MRVCSGKFEARQRMYIMLPSEKKDQAYPSLSSLWLRTERVVDEAYAGDVIGVFDPGICSPSEIRSAHQAERSSTYEGIPTFAPEHFCRVVAAQQSMKRKQFVKGVTQIAQEGAIQIFPGLQCWKCQR